MPSIELIRCLSVLCLLFPHTRWNYFIVPRTTAASQSCAERIHHLPKNTLLEVMRGSTSVDTYTKSHEILFTRPAFTRHHLPPTHECYNINILMNIRSQHPPFHLKPQRLEMLANSKHRCMHPTRSLISICSPMHSSSAVLNWYVP